MAQHARWIESLLLRPGAYRLLQRCLGARGAHRQFVESHVRPQPGHRVLDVGCGTGDILSVMAGVHYVGIDVNERYIEAARERFGRRGTFFCMDARTARPVCSDSFQRIIAFGLLHHLDDGDMPTLLKLVESNLADRGRFLTIDPVLVEGQSPIARWLVQHDRGANVRCADHYRRLVTPAFERVALTLRRDLLRVPYTHLIMECSR